MGLEKNHSIIFLTHRLYVFLSKTGDELWLKLNVHFSRMHRSYKFSEETRTQSYVRNIKRGKRCFSYANNHFILLWWISFENGHNLFHFTWQDFVEIMIKKESILYLCRLLEMLPNNKTFQKYALNDQFTMSYYKQYICLKFISILK